MGKLLLICFTSLLCFSHPFYLGVTDLKYNPKEQALQGSVKLFINDLEGALKKLNKKTVDLVNVKDSSATRIMLVQYLNAHLQLQINDKPGKLDFIGFEREEEALWMYVEIKCSPPKKIQIQNTLLFDYLQDQTNIVHLQVNGERKSEKASQPERDFLFEFIK